MRWGQARQFLTPVLMLLALACLVRGAFLIYVPAGWLVAGLGLAYLGVVADGSDDDRRTGQRP